MKIFNWMHRKLQSNGKYCQVTTKKQDTFDGEGLEPLFEPALEKETEGLLLHDILNGILTIGTLGSPHPPMLPQFYFEQEEVPEEKEAEIQVEEKEEKQSELVLAANHPLASSTVESFTIKSLFEEENKMDILVREVQENDKILEFPLLKEDKEKQEQRRMTLAELFAADSFNNNVEVQAKTEERNYNISKCKQRATYHKEQHKKNKGEKSAPATTTTTATTINTRKLQKLMMRMLRKKIHPEMASQKEEVLKDEISKAERPLIAGQAATVQF